MKTSYYPIALVVCLLASAGVVRAEEHSAGSVGDLPGFGEDAYFASGSSFAGDPDPAGDPDSAGDPAVADPDLALETSGAPDRDETPSDEAVTQAGVAQAGVAQASVGESSTAQYVGDDWQPDARGALARDADGLQPVGHHDGWVDFGEGHRAGLQPVCHGCANGCDGCCDSGYFQASCGIRGGCRIGRVIDCNTWLTAEALLWFPQARRLPVLVASAPAGGLPILDPGGALPAGVTNLFGDEVGEALSGGFRVDYGRWVNDRVGIGGRFWMLGDNEESYRASGIDGDTITVGRPFFNTAAAAEDALLIAYSDLDTEFTGDVSAESSLEMLAAEAYARIRLSCATDHQLDLIGGYTHFQIDDTLSLFSRTETLRSLPPDPVPGTVREFTDSFVAENRFHGGQVGFELSATRGCWMVRTLTKVHLGNMQQHYRIRGSSEAGLIGNTQTFDVGMLAQENNSGSFERDVFSFVPEMNFKIGYRFRPNVLLSAGYSFLYFDNVALNGAVVDRAIDGPLLGTGVSGDRPAFVFEDSSLWVQGIDLGMMIDF